MSLKSKLKAVSRFSMELLSMNRVSVPNQSPSRRLSVTARKLSVSNSIAIALIKEYSAHQSVIVAIAPTQLITKKREKTLWVS